MYEIAGICLDEIGERMKIRQAVQQGRIEEGISLINDLNPEVPTCIDTCISRSAL